MRARIVAAAIVIILLASAAASFGYRQSWKADPYPAIGMPAVTGAINPAQPGHSGPAGGLSSIDFLGQVRRQLDFGRLISLLPFSWSSGRAADAGDRARYLGFSYEPTNASPQGSLYYTGELYDGRRIYVPVQGNRPGDVPDLIFLKDGAAIEDGAGYAGYAISGKPAVYAYVPYAAFNVNETVSFGLANDGTTTVELPNAAPFEVRHKEGNAWRTVFYPVAAQVITRLPNGSRAVWHWDQQADDGSMARPGDYEARINGTYSVAFRIATDTPAVMKSDVDYDPVIVRALAGSSPVPKAFGQAHPSPAGGLKDDVASIMQYKAWALGLDPGRLRTAIEAAGSDGLPCLAVHASFEGQPAWIVLFSPGTSAALPANVYVVTDASGSIAYKT